MKKALLLLLQIDPSLDRDLVHERYGQNGEVTLKSLNNVQKVPLTKELELLFVHLRILM